ncbi:MAG: 4-hydroxythreonine-4-phosphate dehydrogenase PdxA [Gammaproteobacteria bacterium]|nr:MAG: 4-hydroxythreonine-4-phosphate dehydrogenase PdxA [Gammaproteobacteria bacterium]
MVVTAGEPAGIGPELCLALARTDWASRLVIIADPDMLAERAKTLGSKIKIRIYDSNTPGAANELRVLPQKLVNTAVCGEPDTANSRVLLDGLERAVSGCISGEFSALITAPLQKSVINDAGVNFTGHTEFLAELTATPMPVMLLAAGELRVALASTHLPLREVASYLTRDRLVDVITILQQDLISKFGIARPRILVCGLNPHAGEGGHLGTEDNEVIAPAIATCQAIGMDIHGPIPADTAFTPAAGKADAILAMYHDQGLPVVKYAGFGNAVNITLGLPIIRTSVDHGTALDIAGRGTADNGSMIAAVGMAAKLAATISIAVSVGTAARLAATSSAVVSAGTAAQLAAKK